MWPDLKLKLLSSNGRHTHTHTIWDLNAIGDKLVGVNLS